MENYSTESFLCGFIRFACRVGYPETLMPDAGSQLIKGCKEMELEFHDIKQTLHCEYVVQSLFFYSLNCRTENRYFQGL